MDFEWKYNFNISAFVGLLYDLFVNARTWIPSRWVNRIWWAPGYTTGFLEPVTHINILDLKLSPCTVCCIISFGWCPSVWILCVDVSEHFHFIGGVSRNIIVIIVIPAYRWYLILFCTCFTPTRTVHFLITSVLFRQLDHSVAVVLPLSVLLSRQGRSKSTSYICFVLCGHLKMTRKEQPFPVLVSAEVRVCSCWFTSSCAPLPVTFLAEKATGSKCSKIYFLTGFIAACHLSHWSVRETGLRCFTTKGDSTWNVKLTF